MDIDKPRSAVPLQFSQLHVGDEFTVAQVSVLTRDGIAVEVPAETVIKITRVGFDDFTAYCEKLGKTVFNAEEAKEFLVEDME